MLVPIASTIFLPNQDLVTRFNSAPVEIFFIINLPTRALAQHLVRGEPVRARKLRILEFRPERANGILSGISPLNQQKIMNFVTYVLRTRIRAIVSGFLSDVISGFVCFQCSFFLGDLSRHGTSKMMYGYCLTKMRNV